MNRQIQREISAFGYRVVVTRYEGRTTKVESFGPMAWNAAVATAWEHGRNFHAEVQSAESDAPMLRVAYGKASN